MIIPKTFKASIKTKAGHPSLKEGDVFFFHPKNNHLHDKVIYSIKHEVFEFSNEDVLFTDKQIEKYQNYLQLHPVSGVGETFSHGVKYKLNRRSEFGKTVYSIKVGNQEADLIMNWCNRQKIEWVHGRKINWKIWQVVVPSLALIAFCIFGYLNYIKPTQGTTPPATADTLQKNNTNLLLPHGVDTTQKSDSITSLNVASDTTKHE
jgi:hypothetical protein